MSVAIYALVTVGLSTLTYTWGSKRRFTKLQWMLDEVHAQGLFIGGADAILALAKNLANEEALEMEAARNKPATPPAIQRRVRTTKPQRKKRTRSRR